ncbi:MULTISPECIES: DUF732 domain-containing protein [unclassified Mycobacterium]|uniref:DUF732 domain-containing protein n=1 Tax=unclassified Mycobacterium TaxID=2642494 RepID=UPI002740FF66|nr:MULTISPECIES: DUF732 domain-containing protein [unclassified Mycobacterium]MDP7702674.1 DUF732 domain-containing protein [Mycobacterium sp. TY815]MDP7721166.1 DUF732 domain-containing protein [Mycobacterium sp. TY814]
MSTRITLAAGSLLAGVSLLYGAAAVNAAASWADTAQDDQFLALLDQKGVSAISGVPALIATAHQICGGLASGMSADALLDALVDTANTVTPGADPARLVRTESRFLDAAVEAYCPNNRGRVVFTNPAAWSQSKHVVVLASSLIKGANPEIPAPPGPGVEAQNLTPPAVVAPPQPRKPAPPVVGPPPGGGGGGGGTGGGTGGVSPMPPLEPGIITLAP